MLPVFSYSDMTEEFNYELKEIEGFLCIKQGRPVMYDDDDDPYEVNDSEWLLTIRHNFTGVEHHIDNFTKEFSVPETTLEQLDIIVLLNKFCKRAVEYLAMLNRYLDMNSRNENVEKELIEAYKVLISEWPL